MSTANQATLIIALTTVIFPLVSGAGLSLVLNRLLVSEKSQKTSSLIALVLSLLVSFVGILSLGQLWGADAIRYLFWSPLLAGIFWQFVNRQWLFKCMPIILVAISTYMLSAPLKGVWREGIDLALLNEFLVPAMALAVLGLQVNLKSMQQSQAQPQTQIQAELQTELQTELQVVKPADFAALALTFGFAAPVIGLSGSASLAQLLAAFGLSVAGVGLMALWKGFELSQASYITAYFTLFCTLLYAHLYLSPALSPSLFCLLILAPSCTSLSSLWSLRPFKQTLLAIALCLPLLLVALGLVASKELNSQANQQETDEFGASY